MEFYTTRTYQPSTLARAFEDDCSTIPTFVTSSEHERDTHMKVLVRARKVLQMQKSRPRDGSGSVGWDEIRPNYEPLSAYSLSLAALT